MEIVFPDIPAYAGWTKPVRAEVTVEGLELLEGHLPPGINGTLYRAGPDRQFPSVLEEDVFIDGEGMMHMFRLDDGFISYKSRWSRSQRFLAQEQLRKGIFGRYRNRYTAAPEAEGIHAGAANTSMLYHAGKLMVLKEDDLPYEIDPDTLETGIRTDHDGQVTAERLAAHPKIDTETDELLTFSFQAKGDGSKDIAIYIFDKDGQKTQELWFEAPWAGVVHDFAITEHYIVMPFFPLITDMEAVKQGKTFYEWHEDKPSWVAIIPRYGKAEDIRWFQGPNLSAGHMMNAYEDGDQIHLDLCLYEGNCFPFFLTPDGRETEPVPPILSRMSFDLADDSDTFMYRPIVPIPGELPQTDERFQSRPYRYGFMSMGRKPDGSSTVGRVDVTTGEAEMWQHGERLSVHEAQFIPRSADAAEADGWILIILNRLDEGHSELALLDAQKISEGPVARWYIPVRIRTTFHGCWVPAA